jgi:aldehyde oxidoreductase
MAGSISFQVNGEHHKIEPPGDLTLLVFLRDYLGLAGSKNGCNQGHCGSCTVIVDGKAKRACTIKVAKLNGSKIETIESLSANGDLHPLQTAFMKKGQCSAASAPPV